MERMIVSNMPYKNGLVHAAYKLRKLFLLLVLLLKMIIQIKSRNVPPHSCGNNNIKVLGMPLGSTRVRAEHSPVSVVMTCWDCPPPNRGRYALRLPAKFFAKIRQGLSISALSEKTPDNCDI